MKAKVYRIKENPEIMNDIERYEEMGLPNAKTDIAALKAQLREEVDITFDENDIGYMIVFLSSEINKKIISIGLKSGFDFDMVYDKTLEARINKLLP